MSLHSSLTGANLHTAFRSIYADSTARTSESGYTSADVDKIALQQSDNTLWLCTGVTSGVPTWAALAASGSGDLVAANNLSDVASISTARTNLGLGSAATHASTDFDAAGSAATAQSTAESFATSAISALSLGTASTHSASDFAQVSNNLSDLASASSARTNLGLGTAATHAASDFDSAGAASTAQSNAEAFATSAIAAQTFTLAADTDVDISEPSNGQVLTYNSTASKWENADASGGSSISTTTPTATTSSIADSAYDNDQVLIVGSAGIIGSLTTSASCYVRVYTDSASASADTRTVIPSDGGYVAPGSGASTVEGLLFEYWYAPGSLTPPIRPFAYYDSADSGLPLKICNTSGTTQTITLTAKIQELVS